MLIRRAQCSRGSPSPDLTVGRNRVVQLDVLRGVAILLVLMYHPAVRYQSFGEVPWIASVSFHVGWTGVNLFFVLSGFLVGGLLLNELKTHDNIGMRRFLFRRALKIWPSYYVLLGVTSIQVLRHGAAARQLWPFLIHVQNYEPSALWLLPHSWSLAVEEHFYILLPLTLTAFRQGRRRAFLGVTWLVMGVGCALARAFDRPTFPTFVTHHNLDALAWGVLLAYLGSARSAKGITSHPVLSIAGGLGFLALSFYHEGEDNRWAPALVPIGLYIGYGQLLVGVLNLPSDYFRSRLIRFLAFIGFYSYGIYLWHVTIPLPVCLWLDMIAKSYGISASLRWSLITPLYVGLAIGVGVLTARTIERPFLVLRDRLFPRPAVAFARLPIGERPSNSAGLS